MRGMHRSGPGRGRRHAAVVVAAVLLGTVAGAVPSSLGAGSTSRQPIREVGTLARVPPDAVEMLGTRIVPRPPGPDVDPEGYYNPAWAAFAGTIVLFPEVRQLWQIYPYADKGTSERRAVALIRDADTLRAIGTFEFVAYPNRHGSSEDAPKGEWVATSDGKGRAFFLVGHQTTNWGVLEVDLRTLAQRLLPMPFVNGPAVNLMLPGGLTYDAGTDSLWALFGPTSGLGSSAVYSTYLMQLDLGTGSVVGQRNVRSCDGPYQGSVDAELYDSPPMVLEEFIYIVCQRNGYSGAVVRIPRASALQPHGPETFVVGPPNPKAVFNDPSSGRMFLMTIDAEFWVFDTRAMAFVGVVAGDRSIEQSVGAGLDPATGRLFFQSPIRGVGVAEGRFFPIPQAVTLDRRSGGAERIWSDAATNRIYILTSPNPEREHDRAEGYTIYETDPAPVPPPPFDPDRNTVDLPEAPGVTDARFNANASGYGARVLLAKGFSTVAPAPAFAKVAPTAQVIDENINPKCGYADRELVAGSVARAEYDTGSSAAEAIAVKVDDRTLVDLERPSRCDVNVRNQGTEQFKGIFATAPALADAVDNQPGAPSRWQRRPAVCSSSAGGGAESARGDDGDDPPLGTSSVTCPAPGGELVAHGEASLTGALSVGRARTDTRIHRDATGVHARVESIASDISLGGAVRIAEVRSIATSVSNGRPQAEPMSTHTITIRGVSIEGVPVCGVCDPGEVIDTVNQNVAGRAQFRLGTHSLDRRLVQGTPGGAVTAVQKSIEQQASDQALVGDFSTEIPGLEIVVYNDNYKWGRARQLYQLAGVATSATYNIVPIPPDGGAEPASFLPGPIGIPGLPTGALPSIAVPSVGPAMPAPTSAPSGPLTPTRVVQAVAGVAADGLRLLFTDPRQALLLLTGWAMFAAPWVLGRRRRLLDAPDTSGTSR